MTGSSGRRFSGRSAVPEALENPAGMLRTLSSLAVTGESDPLTVPSNSGASSWNNPYECSASVGSTSMG